MIERVKHNEASISHVSDKTNLVPFVSSLVELGYEIILPVVQKRWKLQVKTINLR